MDVARHLVALGTDADCPGESVTLGPLRLQKLLYYSQGWTLGLLGRPLFADPIEAWRQGPVVPAVAGPFATIPRGLTLTDFGPCEELAEVEARLVAMIWREHARYTPCQLAAMTRSEAPWRDAFATGERAEITTLAMTEFFGAEQAKYRKNGWPTPAEVWRADSEVDETSGVDARTLFAQLLRGV